MDQAQIGPGWALLAAFILWGLGALDESIADVDPLGPPPVAQCFLVIRLQCEVDDAARRGDLLTESVRSR